MGKIPVLMATQHPDSAKKYIPVQEEVDEALRTFLDGYDEYKVDYEGKLTPYHQVSQIVLKLITSRLVPGKDVFVTPRMPSATEETAFRQIMSIMATIEAIYLAQDLVENPAVIEVIHPMTKDVRDLVHARKRVDRAVILARDELGVKLNPADLKIIPLLESVPALLDVDQMVKEYLRGAGKPDYMRVFLGRSDSAMMSGFIASVLALKVAISKLYTTSEDLNMDIHPIIGAGTLPFRGHLTPENAEKFVKEFGGCRTTTIQSALRYDYPRREVKRLNKYLKGELPRSKPVVFNKGELEELIKIIRVATRAYKRFFAKTTEVISRISEIVPNQRDRLLASSEVKYGRALKGKELLLPRVIKATAAFYTIGLPPEFLGLGSFLTSLKTKQLQLLREVYPSLVSDLERAGRFLNLDVAAKFIGNSLSKVLVREVRKAKEALGFEVETDEDYRGLLTIVKPHLSILLRKPNSDIAKDARRIICQLGLLRGALG